MRCGFCGYEFDPADAQPSCVACPMAGGCHLIRCPRCGYEMPPESKLVGWLRKVRAGVRVRTAASRHSQEQIDVQSVDKEGQ